MAVRTLGNSAIPLPEINNLVHLDYEGSVLNAVVDFVEVKSCDCATLTLCLTTDLRKGQCCFWLDEDGRRYPATVEDSMTDWGMTTIRLRVGSVGETADSSRAAA
jgi:hypothetical protein